MRILRRSIGDAADISYERNNIPKGVKYRIKQTGEDTYELSFWVEVEERILQCEECSRWFISAEEYFCGNECADKYWGV